MKALILYRPNSEHARKVEEFLHEFERLYPSKKIELMSLDTREGANIATVYDIVQQPAILAVRDDGSVLKFWEGEQLPLMNELCGYL